MLKPFFCYFGGKWRAAPHYPAPLYPDIVEPFAGAAGYATRHHTRNVTLCDADPVIAGLWEYLIKVPAAEILALPDVPLDGTVDDIPSTPQEARWLIGFWLNGGSAVPKKSPGAWMKKAAAGTWGGSQLCWGARVRERLAYQVGQIRHWKVLRGSYADIPDRHATWFVDPPYQQAGKHYRCGSKSVDFAHLGAWCRERSGQVLVCENEGATWLPFQPFRTIKGASGAARTGKSVEVLWQNPLSEMLS